MENNKNERILGYKTASVITKEELEKVSGGLGSTHFTGSGSGYRTGADIGFDVVWD